MNNWKTVRAIHSTTRPSTTKLRYALRAKRMFDRARTTAVSPTTILAILRANIPSPVPPAAQPPALRSSWTYFSLASSR
ncbi:MAG TPA: hypothetical protein VND41_04510 [Nitrososphaerales archaeon]|nr:hypothetical protein [Nitrososphaerales archaeon]